MDRLRLNKKNLGEEDASIGDTLHFMGNALVLRVPDYPFNERYIKLREAQKVYMDALRIRRKHRGATHRSAADTMVEIANVLKMMATTQVSRTFASELCNLNPNSSFIIHRHHQSS